MLNDAWVNLLGVALGGVFGGNSSIKQNDNLSTRTTLKKSR